MNQWAPFSSRFAVWYRRLMFRHWRRANELIDLFNVLHVSTATLPWARIRSRNSSKCAKKCYKRTASSNHRLDVCKRSVWALSLSGPRARNKRDEVIFRIQVHAIIWQYHQSDKKSHIWFKLSHFARLHLFYLRLYCTLFVPCSAVADPESKFRIRNKRPHSHTHSVSFHTHIFSRPLDAEQMKDGSNAATPYRSNKFCFLTFRCHRRLWQSWCKHRQWKTAIIREYFLFSLRKVRRRNAINKCFFLWFIWRVSAVDANACAAVVEDDSQRERQIGLLTSGLVNMCERDLNRVQNCLKEVL